MNPKWNGFWFVVWNVVWLSVEEVSLDVAITFLLVLILEWNDGPMFHHRLLWHVKTFHHPSRNVSVVLLIATNVFFFFFFCGKAWKKQEKYLALGLINLRQYWTNGSTRTSLFQVSQQFLSWWFSNCLELTSVSLY